MNKIFVLSIIVFVTCRCGSNADVVDKKGVKSISISILDKNFERVEREINIMNSDSIKYIIKRLNDCNPEPVKFFPTYTLIINYKDNKVIKITCNGKGMKDNKGHTYMLDKRIEDIVGL